ATAAGSSCGYTHGPRGPAQHARGDNPTEDAHVRTRATPRADHDPGRPQRAGAVGWSGAARRSGTPAAARCRAAAATCARLDVASTGSPVSPGDLLEREVLEFFVRD